MPYAEVEPDEVKARIARGEDVFLLDVREPDEVEAWAYPVGINIPLGPAGRPPRRDPPRRDRRGGLPPRRPLCHGGAGAQRRRLDGREPDRRRGGLGGRGRAVLKSGALTSRDRRQEGPHFSRSASPSTPMVSSQRINAPAGSSPPRRCPPRPKNWSREVWPDQQMRCRPRHAHQACRAQRGTFSAHQPRRRTARGPRCSPKPKGLHASSPLCRPGATHRPIIVCRLSERVCVAIDIATLSSGGTSSGGGIGGLEAGRER